MKIMKIIFVLLLAVVLINNVSVVEASQKLTASGIINAADSFLDTGKDNNIGNSDLRNVSTTIYNVFLVIGIIAAIIIGILMGMKYIMGSIEEKAEVKGMFIVYVIGCIVVFGAFGIWSALVNILQ